MITVRTMVLTDNYIIYHSDTDDDYDSNITNNAFIVQTLICSSHATSNWGGSIKGITSIFTDFLNDCQRCL